MLAPGKQAGRQESPSTHLPPHFLPTGAATARRTLLLILTPTGMTWKTRSAQEVSHTLCLLSCTVDRTLGQACAQMPHEPRFSKF